MNPEDLYRYVKPHLEMHQGRWRVVAGWAPWHPKRHMTTRFRCYIYARRVANAWNTEYE